MDTVYIPRIDPTIQEDFLRAHFATAGIADVQTVDWIPRYTTQGCFYQAFVHLDWYNSLLANSLKSSISQNQQRRVYYSGSDYWIILNAINPREPSPNEPHCINADFPRLYEELLIARDSDYAVILSTIVRNAQNVQKFALDTSQCLAYYVHALNYKSQEAYGLKDHTTELAERLREVVTERDELERQLRNITDYNAGIRERHEDKIEQLERECRTSKNMLSRMRHNNSVLRSRLAVKEEIKNDVDARSCSSESSNAGTSSLHAGEIEGWDIVNDAAQDEFESD